MRRNEYITIPDLAKLMGISRIAVYRRVKNGQIKAVRIGRNFAIPKKYIDSILGKELKTKNKDMIDNAVKKVFNEYGETLKLLGKE